jgi:DNA ligase 1
MRLADLVDAAARVAATPARNAKVALLAGLLRRLAPSEVAIAVDLLGGAPRQGRIGVGGRTLAEVDVPAADLPTLELADVEAALTRLRDLGGPGSREAVRRGLRDLLGRATPVERRFLRAWLLGELRQGALEGVLLQALATAWDRDEALVRRAAMLAGSLAEAATAARAGDASLLAVRLRPLRPVQPMLAAGASSIGDALGAARPAATGGAVAVEWKLDGLRVQAHRVDGAVRVFSRALLDVTEEVPEVVEVVLDLEADAVVLDGETLLLRPDGRPAPFQESSRRGVRRTPFFFDVLHLDGADLLDAPYRERRAVLERIVPARFRVPATVVADGVAAEAQLDEALGHGHEGVVVKELDAPYEAGRRGAAWRKVKPVHTLDLVVLAVEWGSGRRRGWLSNLHLGARDEGGGFVMLGKTFKGLTDELLEWQTQELLARETRREGQVVWVRPELVVEVAFDGLQTSPRYPGGVALRFARVKRYRRDKQADEADTLAAVLRLHRGRER